MKDGVITITNDGKGIQSPYVGVANMVGIDNTEVGVFKADTRLVEMTGVASPTGLVTAINGDFYGTQDGYLYLNSTLIASGLGWISDIQRYEDYLIISTFTSSSLHLYGPISNNPQLFNGWQTGFTPGCHKKICLGVDDNNYIANGNKIAKISDAFSGGTPYVAPTDSGFTLNALDIPSEFTIESICEYGTRLALLATSNYQNARLIFWDRLSDSFDEVVYLPERDCNQMISINNRLFVFASQTGKLYETNTVQWTEVAQLPYIINNQSNSSNASFATSICSFGSEILIGVGTSVSGIYDYTPAGIYSFGAQGLRLKSIVSGGYSGAPTETGITYIGGIYSDGDSYKLGWGHGTIGGAGTWKIDESSIYPATAYNGYIETEMYNVGTPLSKKTFKMIEFILTRQLFSPQSGSCAIRLKYRKEMGDDWTTYATYDYATLGSKDSWKDNLAIRDCVNIQFRIEWNLGTFYSILNRQLPIRTILIQ